MATGKRRHVIDPPKFVVGVFILLYLFMGRRLVTPLFLAASQATWVLGVEAWNQTRLPGSCSSGDLAGLIVGALLDPDIYCPIIRGERPILSIRIAAKRDLPKLSSSCTTVVIAREGPGLSLKPRTIRR